MAFTGGLKVQTLEENTYVPLPGAKVTITNTPGESTSPQQATLSSDSSGLTAQTELNAPPPEYSQRPSKNIPYSLYDLRVEAPGYVPLMIRGCQIYPERTALQICNMTKQQRGENRQEGIIDILANTLVGNYPEKIPEDPEKPLPKPTGGVVLAQPVVPEFVIVHAGRPDDDSAPNYTVPFKNYIKNVACCEIFSTWPETTITANLYCIISFTLNRIYTEWYRGKGKNFDITNSTAFDHAFNYGRNIYDNISRIVDGIFSTYMKRPNAKQPLLAQYCDGIKVKCPGWLTQWGSKYLGDQGKTPYEILKNFYGPDLSLTTAEKVKGIPKSYPGYVLTLGSRGIPVRTVQTYLNRIAQAYPAIPKQAVDGIYGAETRKAVMTFQGIFSLPKTGNVDYATWYKISDVYVGVTKIAELTREEETELFIPPVLYGFNSLKDMPSIEYPWDSD